MRRSISALATTDAICWRSFWLISSAVDWMFSSAALSSSARNASSDFALLVEDREIVGEVVEDVVDDRVDLAIERVLVPHRRRPAEAGMRELVDEQARRVRLLGEERAVEHRGLEHRDLQPREQRLDAVGQVLGVEDEVEQHRDHLDGHRFELVRLRAERRFLQVAQDVVQALRDAGERDLRAADVEIGLPRLQAGQAFVQVRAT